MNHLNKSETIFKAVTSHDRKVSLSLNRKAKMFLKLFFPFLLAGLLLNEQTSAQAVNPLLVLPGYTCTSTQPCSAVEDVHCNPLNECQCNFGFYPAGGKEYKDCYPKICLDDGNCEYYYGPNVQCDSISHSCFCKAGWKLDSYTQQCIDKTIP